MGPARSVEQTRCEFVEVSAPTLPLVRSTQRFEIHYVHSDFGSVRSKAVLGGLHHEHSLCDG